MIKERKALSTWTLFENLIRRILKATAPNFGLFDRVYYAKINKVNIAEGKVDDVDKRISANLQILNPDFSEDNRFEEVRDVPFDTNFFGADSGFFIAPPEGAIVRMGFMYNDPCYPFIISITNEGKNVPLFDADTFKIVTSAGDTIIAKDGEIELRINGGAALKLSASDIEWKDGTYNTTLKTVVAEFLSHTQLGNMGVPTGNPSTGIPPIVAANFQTGEL